MDSVCFAFKGTFIIDKNDVLDYFDSEGIEYDIDTVELTMKDFIATAEWYAETGSLEFTDIYPV